MRRWRIRLGVWLGAAAILVGCYLPYHLAADIVHAASHPHAAHEHQYGAGSSHHHDRGQHRHDGCAICPALSLSVAATPLPAPVSLAPPEREAVTHLALVAAAAPSRPHAHTPYAPRAPPTLV